MAEFPAMIFEFLIIITFHINHNILFHGMFLILIHPLNQEKLLDNNHTSCNLTPTVSTGIDIIFFAFSSVGG